MEIIKVKNGKERYKEKVYLPNRRTQTKTFCRKTDAVDWKRSREFELAKNKALGIHGLKDNVTFTEMFDFWMALKIEPVRSAKTVADYRCVGRKHLKKYFGTLKIRSIEVGHADQLIQKLKAQGLVNKTANKVLALFKQVLKYAEEEGRIHRSPLRNIPKLKTEPGRKDYLTRQEILQLLRANAHEDIYIILLVALNTGMRIGELTGLCWDRVNFQTDLIEVSRAMTRGGLKESTKTNLVRYIPMNPEVRKCLWSLMVKQKSAEFVFVDKKGNPFNPDHFSKRHLQAALVKAQVRPITFHILRHTYASTYMMNGGNVYDLQKILGHTKIEMTMVYAHLSPQHLSGAMKTVRYSAEGDQSDSPYLALVNSQKENPTIQGPVSS